MEELNQKLWQWIDKGYHIHIHSAIKQKPLERYVGQLELVRPAPKNLTDFFRNKKLRKVYKDRTVSILGKVYEAPVALIDKRVSLLFHKDEPDRIEVQYNGCSYGFLVPLDAHLNSRLLRDSSKTVQMSETHQETNQEGNSKGNSSYQGGKLFGRKGEDNEL
ncbi:MAG: hypothetical protein ACOC7U_09190 [Spirochaetota bacterium]